MKPLPTLLILSLICLTACAQVRSEPPDIMSLCPVPIAYGTAFQAQLADELTSLPDHPALWRAMLDYGQLRAALREC